MLPFSRLLKQRAADCSGWARPADASDWTPSAAQKLPVGGALKQPHHGHQQRQRRARTQHQGHVSAAAAQHKQQGHHPQHQQQLAHFQPQVELEQGQLLLVLAVVPLLFVLRRRSAYVPLVLRAGSSLALLMAGVWLVERSTDWRLPGV